MTSDKHSGALPLPEMDAKKLLKKYETLEKQFIWDVRYDLEQSDETYRKLWDRFDQAYYALMRCNSKCATTAEKQLARKFPTILKQLLDYQAAYLFRGGFRTFFHLYEKLTLEHLAAQLDEYDRHVHPWRWWR